MKYTATIFFVFFFTSALHAQVYLNVSGGIINYGGDLQNKNFTLNQAGSAFGFGLTYRFSDYFSVAGTYTGGKIKASDVYNSSRNTKRNLSFYSHISEGSILLEAQLYNVPGTAKFTPYIFAGIGVYSFNPYTFDTSGRKVFLQPLRTEGQGLAAYPDRKIYNLTQLSIPFGIGIRYALSETVLVSAEISLRKLFTDYLDDASTAYADTALLRLANGPLSADLSFRGDELKPPTNFVSGSRRGNPDHNDNYYTGLIKLSFSLNNFNNANNSSFSRRTQKQTGCPKKVL